MFADSISICYIKADLAEFTSRKFNMICICMNIDVKVDSCCIVVLYLKL